MGKIKDEISESSKSYLLVFKYYVYRSREKHILNIVILINNLIEIKKKEKRISLADNNKTKTFNKNGTLQLTFYLWLDNMHYEGILGGYEGNFCFVSLFC